MSMSLGQAQAVVAGALASARAMGTKPLAVMVIDSGGHAVAYAREDGATIFRHDIALAKAYGALGMGDDTRILAERATANPAFFNSVSVATGGRIAFSAGGVVIRDSLGMIVGAVGISGDTGERDDKCAVAGIIAAGLSGGPT